MLRSLASLAGCEVRIWRLGRGRLRPVVGCDGVDAPAVEVHDDGFVIALDAGRTVTSVPKLEGYWYEIVEGRHGAPARADVEPMLGDLLSGERETLQLAKLLAARYEEIELLYTITETLGRTVDLHEAAQKIVESVSNVVGAERASILVADEAGDVLHAVAGVGKPLTELGPVAVDDPTSIAAQAYRQARVIAYDPRPPARGRPADTAGRNYRGEAFLSVPIVSADRPLGVINLTDRSARDAFSGGERRLVQAAASQIGVAIENAHLVARDREQTRLRHELELAHDLQLKLLPSVASLGAGVDLGAWCQPAESVGGDFYYFLKLPGGRLGVMLGDVSSHGFSAALIMASVLSAAGIHAEEAATADAVLRRLLHTIEAELAQTEMFLSLFYAVADPDAGLLRYANAGHPHAFRLNRTGASVRLAATSPPLGITERDAITAAETSWTAGEDLLVLFSDGVADAASPDGERFGEERVLRLADGVRDRPAAEITDCVTRAVTAFAPAAADDRTLLVLRA